MPVEVLMPHEQQSTVFFAGGAEELVETAVAG